MGGPYKPTRFTEPYPMLTKTFCIFQKYYFKYWYALYMEVELSKYIKLKLNYEYV